MFIFLPVKLKYNLKHNKHILHIFSGKPLGFENVFTAFGVGLLGLITSLGLFVLEKITTRYGFFKKLFNAYNYRIREEPITYGMVHCKRCQAKIVKKLDDDYQLSQELRRHSVL